MKILISIIILLAIVVSCSEELGQNINNEQDNNIKYKKLNQTQSLSSEHQEMLDTIVPKVIGYYSFNDSIISVANHSLIIHTDTLKHYRIELTTLNEGDIDVMFQFDALSNFGGSSDKKSCSRNGLDCGTMCVWQQLTIGNACICSGTQGSAGCAIYTENVATGDHHALGISIMPNLNIPIATVYDYNN